MRWRALILAGARGPTDPVAQAACVPHKALAPVAGHPMIEHVVAALRESTEIGDIAVSGPGDLALSADLARLAPAPTPATSVLAALDTLGTPLLVTTADNPLLRPQTISAFLRAAVDAEADAVAGVCPRAIVEQAGNPARRTYLKFRDGAVSGCNLFAFATPRGRAAAAFWRQLETRRKQPWRMASAIGLGVLLRYATGTLDRAHAARAIGKAAGCTADMALLDDPFAAHDVDKPDDLRFAERVLNERLAGD